MKILLMVLLMAWTVVDQQTSLDQLILQGEEALKEGVFRKSEEYLRIALARADSATDKLEKVRIQIDLTSLLMLSGRNVEAEEELQNALTALRTNTDAGKSYLPIVLVNLGAVYIQTGQYKKSESALNEAKGILDRDPSNIRLQVDLLSNLGILYVMTGRGKAAQAVLEHAIAINAKGDNNPVYMARTLTNLAMLYHLQKKWNLAEPVLVRAQQVLEASLGPTPDLAAVLNNLGYVYEAQKKFSKAESVLRRALDIRTQSFGSQNLKVAATEMNLAELLTEEGRFEEAQNLYSHALDVQERLSGPHSSDVASILESLAKVLRLKIDQQAKEMEARAKAIRREQALVRSVH